MTADINGDFKLTLSAGTSYDIWGWASQSSGVGPVTLGGKVRVSGDAETSEALIVRLKRID